MGTTSLETTISATEFVTLDELEARMREARANMDEAWKIQSVTTVEEGYTLEQANEAIDQAKMLDAVYRKAWGAWDAALASLAIMQEDYEMMTVDGLVAL